MSFPHACKLPWTQCLGQLRGSCRSLASPQAPAPCVDPRAFALDGLLPSAHVPWISRDPSPTFVRFTAEVYTPAACRAGRVSWLPVRTEAEAEVWSFRAAPAPGSQPLLGTSSQPLGEKAAGVSRSLRGGDPPRGGGRPASGLRGSRHAPGSASSPSPRPGPSLEPSFFFLHVSQLFLDFLPI